MQYGNLNVKRVQAVSCVHHEGKYYVYQMKIMFNTTLWTITKTSTDITLFSIQLMLANPLVTSFTSASKKDDATRLVEFQGWLNQLFDNNSLLSNEMFLTFFEFDSHIPDIKPVIVECVQTQTRDNVPIAAILNTTSKQLIMVSNVQNTASMLNPIDAIKFMINKPDVGSLDTFTIDSNNMLKHASTIGLKFTPTIVTYDDSSNTALVGYDQGLVSVLEFRERIEPWGWVEKSQVKANTKPISGLALDSQNQKFYAISLSRKLRTISLQTSEIINGRLSKLTEKLW